MRTSNPRLSSGAACIAGLLLCLAQLAPAATLVYVFSPDCGACRSFDREIGPIYPRTDEARVAPMLKIDFAEWPAHELAACVNSDVFATPTLILMDGCTELDRITGYSSDELFWFGLQRLMNHLPEQAGID